MRPLFLLSALATASFAAEPAARVNNPSAAERFAMPWAAGARAAFRW